MEISPEVLIYIEKVKNFIDNNSKAKEYFLKNTNREDFFHNLAVVAQGNFENIGQAELTTEQFDGIRISQIMIGAIERYYHKDNLIYTYPSNNFKFYYRK